MTDFQKIIDEANKIARNERSTTQMTLGQMTERLRRLPENTEVPLSGPHSYRGYYSDLSFETKPSTVKQLLSECEDADCSTFTGYKGGEFFMDSNTPIFVASYGCIGEMLMAINDDGSIETEEEKD